MGLGNITSTSFSCLSTTQKIQGFIKLINSINEQLRKVKKASGWGKAKLTISYNTNRYFEWYKSYPIQSKRTTEANLTQYTKKEGQKVFI